MTTPATNDDGQRSRLTRALLALKEMRAQRDEARHARSEPVAVIGVGCRFPGGVTNPDGFWRLLESKGDAITEVPPERWDVDAYYDPNPDAPGKVYTRHGGFVDGVDLFDPEFFGITPREAVSMDPQQRLLLETAWESLEHAGLAPDRLRDSATGVFVGISSSEYSQLVFAAGLAEIDSYAGSGNAHSIAAGRLSYVFGFNGPCLAVDTACSASLAAVHLACQSLRRGECDLAIAGGVNVLLTPVVTVNHSRARMLAPDGRCKAFDAAANGFVRSEGCGLVVLKLLSRAVASRDTVLAVVRGSAINQDGRTSGLTVPSGPSQRAVIQEALRDAGLAPGDVSYIEAHGTGTSLGDPIELSALADVFGCRGQNGRPVVIGSVKTNIGHAEAAAGIAGVIKVVLALQHGLIPPNLHFHRPNPQAAWERFPAVVPSVSVPWPAGERPRIAGVSSFGFGGTNAHVILAEPPVAPSPALDPGRPLHLLALSARNDEGLKTLAKLHADYLPHFRDADLADVCHTANVGRSHFRHRLTLVAESMEQARAKLAAFVDGRETPGLTRGLADPSTAPQVAFLFTGQGSQYVGMGRELFETQPVFRRELERCDQLLRPRLRRPLLEVLYSDHSDSSPLGETGYTQPALFALEYCLGRLWMSWGVVPAAVMGHSVGEYAAACLAGVFTLEDGLELIAARAALMQGLPQGGGMLAVFTTEQDVRDAIESCSPKVSIAAINGARNVVVSGYQSSLDRLAGRLAARGVETRPLNVSHAFHSALVEPILSELARVAACVRWSPPRIDFVSNLTGGLLGLEVATPEYWVRHTRETVRFRDAVRSLHHQGYSAFLEVGPQPVLLGMGRRCLSAGTGQWLPSLKAGQSDWAVMLNSLAALYVCGAPVDWAGFDDGYSRRRRHLPTYPFQRQRYWVKTGQAGSGESPPPGEQDRGLHPLLGKRLHLARHRDEAVFETQIRSTHPPFLDDHRVFGAAIMPWAAYVEIALAAGAAVLKSQPVILENLMFDRALTLSEGAERTVQIVLSLSDSDGYRFEILSRPVPSPIAEEPCWTAHASGTMRVEAGAANSPREDLTALRQRVAEPLSAESLYEAYARHGATYCGWRRAVLELWRGRGEALGRIRLTDDADGFDGYRLHPVLLGAAAQVLGAASDMTDGLHLQSSIERVRVYGKVDRELWGHARLRPSAGGAAVAADLQLIDEQGVVVAEVTGLETRRVDPGSLSGNGTPPPSVEFYEPRWLPLPRSGSVPSPLAIAARLDSVWLIFADQGGLGETLASAFEASGIRSAVVRRGRCFRRRGTTFEVDPTSFDDYRRLLDHHRGEDGPTLGGVVHLWGLDATKTDRLGTASLMLNSLDLAGSVLFVAQALSVAVLSGSPRLWLVTRAAQAVGPGRADLELAQATMCGVGKVITLEHPQIWGGMIDLDPEPMAGEAAILIDELLAPEIEDQVAFRTDRRFVARVARLNPRPRPFPPVRADGVYLIVGGFGALGLETARWLVRRGARHLALIGRNSPAAGAEAAVGDLERLGVKVYRGRADVADLVALRGVVDELDRDWPPLRGVVHAAGLPGSCPVAAMDRATLERMFAAKVAGSWNLHKLSQGRDLEFFICFSSMVSVWGAKGQCHYVAANHFLDVLTHHRRSLGLPSSCVNWGPLSGGGMLPADAAPELARLGIATTELAGAGETLEILLGADVVQAAAVAIDWRPFKNIYESRRQRPLFDMLGTKPGPEAPAPLAASSEITLRLRAAAAGDRREILAEHVRTVLARVLGLEPTRMPDDRQGFFDMGMDSLRAMDLRTKLETSLATPLPSTLAFDYATVETLADYLLTEKLGLGRGLDQSASGASPVGRETTTEMLERLSDQDVELLLMQKLDSI